MNYTTCHTDLLTKSVSKSSYITKKSRKMMGSSESKNRNKKKLTPNQFCHLDQRNLVSHALFIYLLLLVVFK